MTGSVYFISGIDTGIGKTYTTGYLAKLWNEQGQITSNGPANYKIPTAHDCPPELNVAFYRGATPRPTVHRSKAVGEPPFMLGISVLMALSDAVAACGTSYPALDAPATPEKVLMAIERLAALATTAEAAE